MSHKIDREKLLACRKQQFWTQEDLAAASGLSVRTVQRVESQGICSQETLKAIAAAFTFSADVLIVRPVNRVWMLGPAIGMVAGTIGCLSAFMSIFSEASLAGESIYDHGISLFFVTFMLAFTILYPAFFIYIYWDYRYDMQQGTHCNRTRPRRL